MTTMNEWVMPAIVAVFGGGGFWAWLSAQKKGRTDEYAQFVKDLQIERKDREAAIDRLERRIEDQRKTIERLQNKVVKYEFYIKRLEETLAKNNIPIPAEVD